MSQSFKEIFEQKQKEKAAKIAAEQAEKQAAEEKRAKTNERKERAAAERKERPQQKIDLSGMATKDDISNLQGIINALIDKVNALEGEKEKNAGGLELAKIAWADIYKVLERNARQRKATGKLANLQIMNAFMESLK